ncbi:hypothetical protein BT93_F1184 [Corymbia citriodora subsp. variegata]|nr:hypothetical protein BT93_F1184 [Corymbia citriodora subsp. variegata]
MEDQCDSGSVFDRASASPKSLVKSSGEKRHLVTEEKHEVARKRVKMRDLESVLRREGTNNHPPKSLKDEGGKVSSQCGEGLGTSQVTEETVTSIIDGSQEDNSQRNILPVEGNCKPVQLDLNTEICSTNKLDSDVNPEHTGETKETDEGSLLRQHETSSGQHAYSKGLDLNLNAEDLSSSVNLNPFYPYKNLDQLKPVDASECASSTGPLEEKDSLRLWKEMKQNGFLSSSHGGIPIPKQRGRKSKNDVLKKKLELAKKEQVDRFTKIAAPSGLLNELNPGIINHVRNRKQVHSIIEALVRSGRAENSHVGNKHGGHSKGETKEIGYGKGLGCSDNSGMHQLSYSSENVAPSALFERKQTTGFPTSMMSKSSSFISEHEEEDGDLSTVGGLYKKNFVSNPTSISQDDGLALRLSSTMSKASEITWSMSNEDSTAFSSVTSLSVKAATVASQWLELLHQDIKGRLAALKRSKKRVQAVINTELPFLISKEFSSNQENNPYQIKSPIADMHLSKWSTLFGQMDKALTEEEQQLDIWLNQVKEMQLHCEHGLQHVQWNAPHSAENPGAADIISRSNKPDTSERELAVRAAAASIYSTCNFLLAKENVSCC